VKVPANLLHPLPHVVRAVRPQQLGTVHKPAAVVGDGNLQLLVRQRDADADFAGPAGDNAGADSC
jgi:hypothetical protein